MDQDDGVTARIGEARAKPRTTGRHPISSRYTLGGELGRGGMGEVLEAHDAQVGRDVAIKRLRAQEPNERQVQRFMREARIQGRLEHPAIVPVHDVGRDSDGRPYFAMKKLAGVTLAQILAVEAPSRASVQQLGSYSLQRLLRALADVCLAVELAHTRGFVHRDLKPENIMLGGFGETYVLDWGVAKVSGEDDSALVDDTDSGELVTAAGAAVGTPGYMSPEQARGLPDIDARADVYALGCVLFEVLTGERLHPKGQAGMTSAVQGVDPRPSVRVPGREIPPELDELCVHACATDRAERLQSARSLGERIQQYLDGDRDLALRRTLARGHLDAALAAFAADDRSRAMREAGRALALDPRLHAAGELITRMMLEPPKELPVEVTRKFDSESAGIVRRTLGFGAIVSCGYLLFVPLLAILSEVSPVHLTILGVAAGASILMMLWMRTPGRAFVAAPVILIQMILIAVCARMFSPFLLGPGLAGITALGLMTGPQYAKRQATLVAGLAIIAVLAPWVAEVAGLLPATMVMFDGGATIYSPALQGASGFALLIVFTLSIVGATVILSRGAREAERTARRHMHVQAWQLRQLVAAPVD